VSASTPATATTSSPSADQRGTVGVAKPLLLVIFGHWSVIWSHRLHFDHNDYGENNAFEWRRSSFFFLKTLFGDGLWGTRLGRNAPQTRHQLVSSPIRPIRCIMPDTFWWTRLKIWVGLSVRK
jgi:hypothetical protein